MVYLRRICALPSPSGHLVGWSSGSFLLTGSRCT
jgi:hypothetical protein